MKAITILQPYASLIACERHEAGRLSTGERLRDTCGEEKCNQRPRFHNRSDYSERIALYSGRCANGCCNCYSRFS